MRLRNFRNTFIHSTQIGQKNGQLVIGNQQTLIQIIMYIESFLWILKHLYMKGKKNRRIDNLIHVLLKVSKDKDFERLCQLEKGKIPEV